MTHFADPSGLGLPSKRADAVAISVIICCYNSAQRLPATLQHLAAQRGLEHLRWEVIVVDNASTDASGALALAEWHDLGAPAPLRVVSEERKGAQYARVRGTRAARGDLVSFIDDDNWVSEDWIARVVGVMTRNNDVGACGGKSIPVFEGKKPSWFDEFSHSFAAGDQYGFAGYLPHRQQSLWGAGLSMRRSILLDYLRAGWEPLLPCRAGADVSSGGDTELCMLVRLAGWKLWYEPNLILHHFIRRDRCDWPYVVDLWRGFGVAGAAISQYASFGKLGAEDRFANRLRARIVPIWILEFVYSLASLALTYLAFAVRSIPRRRFEILAALKKGRLDGLLAARAGYRQSIHKLWSVLARADENRGARSLSFQDPRLSPPSP